MARRFSSVGNSHSKSKVVGKVSLPVLDYHEGLSSNQVKIILIELGFNLKHIARFNEWMDGQTCKLVIRHNERTGKEERVIGVYEYDLFRWIESQRTKVPPVWD